MEVGFSTIQEVDAAINKGWGKFTADEQAQLDDPENGGVAVFYTASGAVRVAVGWVNPKLTELLRKKLDWSEEEDGVDESFPPS